MKSDELDDFFLEGGDELLNSELCPHCGDAVYLDQKIEWIGKDKRIAKCPSCGGEVKKALRKTLLKYRLHTDEELFNRAYAYIREYY